MYEVQVETVLPCSFQDADFPPQSLIGYVVGQPIKRTFKLNIKTWFWKSFKTYQFCPWLLYTRMSQYGGCWPLWTSMTKTRDLVCLLLSPRLINDIKLLSSFKPLLPTCLPSFLSLSLSPFAYHYLSFSKLVVCRGTIPGCLCKTRQKKFNSFGIGVLESVFV